MAGINITTFSADFESVVSDDPWGESSGKVVLYFGNRRAAEFPTSMVYMDSDELEEFVAEKFGELFDLLRRSTTSDEKEI